MNEHLISPIQLPSSLFYGFRFQQITLKQINQHLTDIQCLHVDEPHDGQALSEKLWLLKERHPENPDIEQAYQDWQTLKHFAHIPSSKLISMMHYTMAPLSNELHSAIERLNQDLKRWRPQWIQKYPIESLASLEEKQKQLIDYQSQCYWVLLKRCQYATLEPDRHCDDDAYIIQKHLSQLVPGAIEPPLNPRLMLSDDARITLYDRLDAQEESIIEDIRRTPYKPPKVFETPPHEAEKLSKLYRFLGLERPQNTPTKPTWAHRVSQSIRGFSNFLATPLERTFRLIYDFRYLIALTLTLALYFWFAPPIIGFTSAIFGQTLAHWAQGILFYGAAMMPVWVFAFKSMNTMTDKIHSWILQDKLNACFESISAFDDHKTLLHGLKVGVLDTYHYDVNTLQQEITKTQSTLKTLEAKLKQSKWYERWFMSAKQRETFKSTRQLLSSHQQRLQKNTLAFCQHLIRRTSVDLIQLTHHKDFGLKPLMVPNQLQALRQFIVHMGNETLLNAFDDAVSLKPQFIKQLNQPTALAYKDFTKNPLTPWGGEKPNLSALNGWQTLCAHSPNQDIASLIQALKTNQVVSPSQLEAMYLAWGEKSVELKKAFSNYLFKCLAHLPPKTVFLLDDAHKTEILKWYEQNQETIQETKRLIKDFIRQPQGAELYQLPIEQAAHLVWLLDGANVARTLLGESQVHHELRDLVEQYNGAQSQMIWLNRFFPKHEQPQVMQRLCAQRLHWLMNHPNTELKREDIELFHAPILFGVLDCKNFIVNHPQFLSEEVKPLLVAMKEIGVIDAPVIAQYESSRQPAQIKETIEHRSLICVK